MFRGMGEKSAVAGLALLAAGAFAAPASAADLGADGCCADLEERVAELEATTARKGNRVVSLQISGNVTQALLAWDNGEDSDTYVVSPTGLSQFVFSGEGQISADFKAGFYVRIFTWSEAQFLVDETSDEANTTDPRFSDGLQIANNELYLESSKLGRVTIGEGSGAADAITSINVAQSVWVRNAGAQLYNGGFTVFDEDGNDTGYAFRDLFGGDSTQAIGEGHRYDRIRYDSPSLAGFKVSASWGEDDYWDVALRYGGLVAGRIKLGAGIAYADFTDRANNGCTTDATGEADCSQIGASIGAMDIPTGLFIHAAYGLRWDDVVEDLGADGDRESLYIQAGIEKNWFGHGATTLFGEYQQVDMGRAYLGGVSAGGLATPIFEDAEATVWGLGVVQSFDAAATSLFATYRNISSESDGVDNAEWDEVYAGARINF